MHKKRFHLFKECSKKIKRIFRTRSIIIVSDYKLDHVPLSGTMQVLMLVGLLGFFSGVSYLTGSYMNARGVIREKDKTIVKARLEKAHVNEEMELLKRDLSSFSSNSKELAEATKYLSAHFGDSGFSLPSQNQPQNGVSPLFTPSADKMSLRVAYLEERVKQMRSENEQLVAAIRTRTDKKIDLFEDIIAMTGLDAERLERDATAKMQSDTNQNASDKAPAAEEGQNSADEKDQGGPFIAYSDRQMREADALLNNVDRLMVLHAIIEKLPLAMPVANAHATGNFGRRVDPFNGRLAIHPGIDLAAPMGSPILATSDGEVTFAGRKAAYGNVVDVEHGFGIVTRYAHLSKVIASEGQKVRKGQVIGLEGSTGRSTGPHLHYEVRIDDHPVNPSKFLEAGEYVSEK